MVLELYFKLASQTKELQNLDVVKVHIEIMQEQNRQNDILYESNIVITRNEQFAKTVILPLIDEIDFNMVLLSVHLNETEKMIETYEFAVFFSKEHNCVTEDLHAFPLASFEIKIEQVFDKTIERVLIHSFKVQELDLPALILPVSKTNFFNTIINQLYNDENELCQSVHGSVVLPTFKDGDVHLSVDNVLLENTPYILQLNLFLKTLTASHYQVFNNEITYDYEFLALIDALYALFSKENQKQTIKYLEGQQLPPSVIHNYLLTGDKKDVLLHVAQSILEKFMNIKKVDLDALLTKYKQLSEDIKQYRLSAAGTRFTYVLSAEKLVSNVNADQRLQSMSNAATFQRFINILLNIDNKVIFVPHPDMKESLLECKLSGSNDILRVPMSNAVGVDESGFYGLLCLQPVILAAYELGDVQIELISGPNGSENTTNLVVTDLVQKVISGIFTDTDKIFYYNTISEIIGPESSLKQQISEETVEEVEDLRKLVFLQEREIAQNDILIKQESEIVKNQKPLSTVELQYLKDNIRLSQQGYFENISDVAQDLMNTFKKEELSKILIQSLQFLNEDSIKTQQLLNKLKHEEEKLLQDQRGLIAEYEKTLNQFERKKMGLSLVQADPAEYQSLNEQTSYIAFDYAEEPEELPESHALKQNSIPDYINNEPQASLINNNSIPENLNDALNKVNKQIREPEVDMIEITEPTSMSFSEVETKPSVRQSSVSENDPKRLIKSEINEYRKPPQILANVSQASRFLEMNMK